MTMDSGDILIGDGVIVRVCEHDASLILEIVDRVRQEAPPNPRRNLEDMLSATTVELAITHLNACPLDLATLLTYPHDSFYEDLYGICFYIDCSNGKFTNELYMPQCALILQHTHSYVMSVELTYKDKPILN